MKKRLDVVLVEQGYFPTRQKAQRAIMAGLVLVNEQREDKAGTSIKEDAKIRIKGERIPYVSRGGIKLKKGIDIFGIDVRDRICMDIGASTGGFTDCMLQEGASKVYSIDVGWGQLDWSLRNDERVICLEKTNMRYVQPDIFNPKASFASIDVSFISLTLILPPTLSCLEEAGELVVLIKPQFEAGKESVGKKGVVKDSKVHKAVIQKIVDFVEECGCSCQGLSFSPIKGPSGNIEYLLYIKKGSCQGIVSERMIEEVVGASHQQLDVE